MSINIGDKPEFNVVNVGDELTSDQLAALQNAQGASATNPCLTRTNTFNTADAAVRITQEGTGDAFVVQDEASDTTPFVITAAGAVGIRTANPTQALHVTGSMQLSSGLLSISNAGTSGSIAISNTNTGMANVGSSFSYAGTGDAVRITNTGTGNSFVVEDEANPDSSPFVITADGRVGIGASIANFALNVAGNTRFAGSSSTFVSTNAGLAVHTVTQLGLGGVASFINNATATADCVRITNLGTGNSFVVEDDTNPDSSPFAITATGNVGIGTGIPTSKLQVQGGGVTFVNGSPSTNYFGLVTSHTGVGLTLSNGATNSSELIGATALGTGSIAVFTNTANSTSDAVRITNLGSGNSFVVEDSTNPDSSPFIINQDGSVGIGTTTPSTKLAVVGSASFAGATSVSTSGANAFTISVTNTSSAVIGSLIDYRGTGNAFRIVNSTTETFNIAGSGAVTLTNYLTLHSGALATSVGSQTYPDELEFKVGSTTYRVPARAI